MNAVCHWNALPVMLTLATSPSKRRMRVIHVIISGQNRTRSAVTIHRRISHSDSLLVTLNFNKTYIIILSAIWKFDEENNLVKGSSVTFWFSDYSLSDKGDNILFYIEIIQAMTTRYIKQKSYICWAIYLITCEIKFWQSRSGDSFAQVSRWLAAYCPIHRQSLSNHQDTVVPIAQ